MVACVVHKGMVCGMSTGEISTNKGTCFEALSGQTAGFMINNCQGNAVTYAFADWEDTDLEPEATDAHTDDYRKKVRSNVWRSRHYCGDPDMRQHACETLWCSGVLDHMWRRLQIMDEQ